MKFTSCGQRGLRNVEASVLAIAVAGILPTHASAQTAAAPISDPTQLAAAAPAAPQESDIVVTGTRLTGRGITAPTPTTVIGGERFEERAATNIATVLYELPAIRPSPAPQIVSQAGGNFANLRGLGQNRTLVLVDGRRFVPTNNQGIVDTNVVPVALISRVDAVTGGASAAYGSDAVAGVVNLVLNKKLEGVSGTLQYGQSGHGDAHNVFGALSYGTGFADDRGHFEIAGEYSKLSDLPTQADRDYSNKHTAFAPGTINGVAYARVRTSGLTMTGYTPGGVIVFGSVGLPVPLGPPSPFAGRQFLSPTSSSPFNYGAINGGFTAVGGDGAWIPDTIHPQVPLERTTVFARGSFDVTSNITAWAEGSYSRTRTDVDLFVNAIPSVTDGSITITRDNPFIPADIRTILNANPAIQSFSLGRLAPDLGYAHTDSRNRILRGAIGIDAQLGDGYSLSAYYTHGATHFNTQYSNNIIEANLRAALDAVTGPAGTPVCRISVTPAAAGTPAFGADAGCVAANPFGPGSLAAVKNYVTGTLGNIADYHQDAGAVTLNGQPFSTWAGPVSFAVGGEFRREFLRQVVSPRSNFVNPPAFGAGGFQQANPKDFSGGINVKEGFGEVNIPLARDLSFARSLDLNGAVRFTDYSTSGSVTSWKVGATYSPVAGILFRGTQSRDIRAANTNELYSMATAYGAVTDYGTAGNPSVNFIQLAVGNRQLKPEIANTTTAGVSLSGGLIPRVSLSIDWYRIKLRNSIGQLGGQGIIDTCYGMGTAAGRTPDATRCALINRTTGIITNPYLNLGSLKTDGVDFDASYRMPLSGVTSVPNSLVTFRMLASYVTSFEINTNGLLLVDRTGDLNGSPRWRFTSDINATVGPATLFLQGRYIGPQDMDKTLTSATAFDNRIIPAIFYLSTSVQYRIIDRPGRRVELYVSIDNLLDRDPPFVGATSGLIGVIPAITGQYTNSSIYDTIGRTFTGGVRVRF